MERKKITIVGVGLIGGSLALQLHEKKISSRLIGVELNEFHAQQALELELIVHAHAPDDSLIREGRSELTRLIGAVAGRKLHCTSAEINKHGFEPDCPVRRQHLFHTATNRQARSSRMVIPCSGEGRANIV